MSRYDEKDNGRVIAAVIACAAVLAGAALIGPVIERWKARIWCEEMQRHGVAAPVGGAK